MAGVGDEQLSNLHVRSVAHPARDRDRGDSKSPQGDWLPDGLAAIPNLVQSWVVGTEGFSVSWLAGSLSFVGLPLMLAWSIWLLIVAWRMKEPDQPGKRPT